MLLLKKYNVTRNVYIGHRCANKFLLDSLNLLLHPQMTLTLNLGAPKYPGANVHMLTSLK